MWVISERVNITLKSLAKVLPGRPLGDHHPSVKDLETILPTTETQDSFVLGSS